MAIDQGKDIKIDGVSYKLIGRPVLTQRKIFPPRIQTSDVRNFESLEEWEHYGMYSFVGGMGQKKPFKDKEMYYDSFGVDILRDNQAKLSRIIEQVKSVADLGITLADMGGSLNIAAMQIYNNALYFAAVEGDWGPSGYGKARLWRWDGTTLTDMSCQCGVSALTADTTAGAAPVVIKVVDGTKFTANRYILITNNDSADYELLHIQSIAGNDLTCDVRGCDITWDVGKTKPTTPFDFKAADNIVVMQLEPSPYDRIPISAGDGVGVNAMCVMDDKLYVGTYTGFVFMYNGYDWYLQPPSVHTIAYTGTARLSGSINHQVASMLAYKDVMYVTFGKRIETYTPGTASGLNPWSGTLHTVRDAYSLNNMVLFGNMIYICSWHDKGDSATVYKFDGTTVTPVFRFPSRFEVHSAIVYDGKIWIGGGKYNFAGNASVGQLYSYDGITMRKVFTIPRNEELESGYLRTFYRLATWDDKLYFSDNYTTGLFCYSAEFDSIHRCNVISTLTGAGGNLVRGIIAYKDMTYLTISGNGLYRVKATDGCDVGGVGRCYGSFTYPYVMTSILGAEYPNMKKMFFKVDFWHHPIISGQKIHLHFSRNQMATWSAVHTITPVTGSTHTEYMLKEEGWANATGGFDGTPTGDYGFEATDLAAVIALQTHNEGWGFDLNGFAIAYLPVPDYEQAIRVTINCTDRPEYAKRWEETDWGIQRIQQLWTACKENRPVVVEHLFDDKGTQKLMIISNLVSPLGPVDTQRWPGPTSEYPVEGIVTLDLLEVGIP